MTSSTAAITDVLGGAIAWRQAGSADGPAAAFFHGLGGNRTNWDPQLAALSGLRECRAWDAPGYGESNGLPTSLPDIASIAATWIESFADQPVDVVGLSFGGMVAQHLALDHPHLVRTLALLDTSPAFGLDGVTTADKWLASRVAPMHDKRSDDERLAAVISGLVGPDCPKEIRDYMVESMRAVPKATLDAACNALVHHDTRTRLPELHVPTVVGVGEYDTETPLAYSELLASLIPDALLVVIPGAGHLSNLEAPQQINDVLRRLWQSVEEARA
jgi:3-oxoadipate enol-lactonase